MSKIICDICGTVYQDNANACPICGYPRPNGDVTVDEGEPAAAATVVSTGTKGGRFSKKNVKSRQSGAVPAESRREKQETRRQERQEEPESKNTVLIVVVAVLAVAVILLGAYIGWRFWQGRNAYDEGNNVVQTNPQENDNTSAPEETTTVPADTGVPCTDLIVSSDAVELNNAGGGWRLIVTAQPENTTDVVTFFSNDDSIAAVDENGRITAVAPGRTTISIICGDVMKECTVICDFEEEPTEPTEETEDVTEPEETTEPTEVPTEPTEPPTPAYSDSNWRISNEDVTLILQESFELELENDAGEVAEVTWTAEHNGVVTIEGNTITGLATGMTNVSATIDGETYTCIVRVIKNR